MMRQFWNWTDNGSERELRINGAIAEESWWGDEVTPEEFRRQLMSGTGGITLWINSPGGDCVAASRIYTMLMDYPGDVTVKIDGMAASAASVIAMAGTKVLMAPTAMMMIHNPLTTAFGDRQELKQAIELLDEVKESIINAYEIRTGLSRSKISKLMDDETWMSARKAIELGFCDGILFGGDESEDREESFDWSPMIAVNSLTAKLLGSRTTPEDAEDAKDADEARTRDAAETAEATGTTETTETTETTGTTERTDPAETEPEETGVRAESLRRRLELLKTMF